MSEAFRVLPERQTETLMVRGHACSDIAKQGPPCVGHAAADSRKVEPESLAWVEKSLSGLVHGESAWAWLLKHALAHKVREYAVQGIGVTTRGDG